MKNLRLLCASALIVASGNAASATITQLNGPGSLLLSNDFEFAQINNADVTFDSTASLALASRYVGSNTPSGGWGVSEAVGDSPLTGILSSSQTGVGIWFGNNDFNLQFSVTLEVLSGNTSLGSVSVVSNGNDAADQFIGLNSRVAFDSFRLSYGPGAQQLSIYADDLYLSSVNPVPVPAAVWLFGSGLVGLVGFARRKRT